MIENDIIRKIKTISINGEHKFGFIAQYVLEHANKISSLTIKQLAVKTFSSPATIHRFVHYIGLDGYKEFIYLFRYYNITHLKNPEIQTETDAAKDINLYFKRLINDLTVTQNLLLTQNYLLTEVSRTIEQANKIYLFSVGGTSHIVRDFAQKLQRLGFSVILSTDYHQGFYLVRQITPGDIAFFISYSGETNDLISLAKTCQINNVKIISLTKQVNNTLSHIANLKLQVISDEPIKRSQSMTSRSTMLFTLDTIYLTILSFDYSKYLSLLKITTIDKI